jgi:hypothetical protein
VKTCLSKTSSHFSIKNAKGSMIFKRLTDWISTILFSHFSGLRLIIIDLFFFHESWKHRFVEFPLHSHYVFSVLCRAKIHLQIALGFHFLGCEVKVRMDLLFLSLIGSSLETLLNVCGGFSGYLLSKSFYKSLNTDFWISSSSDIYFPNFNWTHEKITFVRIEFKNT